VSEDAENSLDPHDHKNVVCTHWTPLHRHNNCSLLAHCGMQPCCTGIVLCSSGDV